MLEFCAVRQDTFHSHQDNEQVNFYKKSSLYFIGQLLRNCKIAAHFQLAKNWNISFKAWQKLFFHQHVQPLHVVLQKEIEKLEFVQWINFELIDSLKNNGTKYLLISDDFCDEKCNSKAFVDITIAGKH